MRWLIQPFRDLVTMIRDIRRESVWLGLWGQALNLPMVVGGAVFVTRPAGVAVLVTNLVAVLIAAHIHKSHPFSRLTSICHLVWAPAIALAVIAIGDPASPMAYRVWLGYTLATMAISLILDARNLYLYATRPGSREMLG